MENIGTMTMSAATGHAETLKATMSSMDDGFSFHGLKIDRASEARRFLFAAAHHGQRGEANLGTFPGKFAWIVVVLFVLSVLIAVIG